MRISATEAKNRFGAVLEMAQTRPVVIEKAGRRHSVVVSAAQFDAMQAASRGSVVKASGKRFYSRYAEWVDEQNRLVEAHGVFGAEWRAW